MRARSGAKEKPIPFAQNMLRCYPDPACGKTIRPTEHRAVVTWAGPGQPIMLRVYGPDGGVAVDLTPKRALTLANELMEPAVASIKIAQWGKPWPG